MSKILAIDSSTEACSVALINEEKIVKRFEVAPRKHAELLLPMVDSVLQKSNIALSELNAIACCVGPGAFTGLRIAISVAQGLAYAANLPCIAISSLQTLAAEAFSHNNHSICLSSIDARMQEVYFAAFKRGQNDLPVEIHPQQVIGAQNISLSARFETEMESFDGDKSNLVRVGTGWKVYQHSADIEFLNAQLLPIQFPNAEMMLAIADACYQKGELLKPELLQPVYLRNDVAKKKSQQK